MTLRKPVLWWIVAVLPLLVARAALPGITDPSEARYAQIAREMAESGDWVVPTWQGIPHLEKPPLTYWVAAAGIRLLGRTEIAVRLGALLTLLASAWLTGGIARRLAGPSAAGPAAAVLLVAPYAVLVGAACLPDAFLLFFVALFFHSVFRHRDDRERHALDLAVAALGMGFLAKGYMVFLFTLLPLALARTGVFRELFRPRRALLLVAMVAPWFVAIELRCPGFLREQFSALGARVGGSGHHAPVFVYVVVLALGLFPFWPHAARGSGAVRAADRRLLLLWLFVPMVVLTAIPSRQWTYILPSVPSVAVLAAGRLGERGRSLRSWHAWICVAAGAVLLLAGFLVPHGETVMSVLPHVGVGLLAGAAWLWASRRLPRGIALGGLSALAVAGVVSASWFHEAPFQIHRGLARDVTRRAEAEGRPVVVAATTMPAMAFYSSEPVVVAGDDCSLVREGRLWGRSGLFLPDVDLRKLLTSDRRSIIVLEERTRAALAPQRVPWLRRGDIVVLCDPARQPAEDAGPAR